MDVGREEVLAAPVYDRQAVLVPVQGGPRGLGAARAEGRVSTGWLRRRAVDQGEQREPQGIVRGGEEVHHVLASIIPCNLDPFFLASKRLGRLVTGKNSKSALNLHQSLAWPAPACVGR